MPANALKIRPGPTSPPLPPPPSQHCVETALAEGVTGDLIEAGVWRGGGSIFMRAVLAAHRIDDRRVWVADSFEGLPPPDADHFPADSGDRHHTRDALAVSLEQVQENFRRYGLLDDNVRFVKGWFKDTLQLVQAERFAVVRLDGDMYESTIQGLALANDEDGLEDIVEVLKLVACADQVACFLFIEAATRLVDVFLAEFIFDILDRQV